MCGFSFLLLEPGGVFQLPVPSGEFLCLLGVQVTWSLAGSGHKGSAEATLYPHTLPCYGGVCPRGCVLGEVASETEVNEAGGTSTTGWVTVIQRAGHPGAAAGFLFHFALFCIVIRGLKEVSS